MAIHRCVRFERLLKLSGSALRLLLCMYLHPRQQAAQRPPRWSCLHTSARNAMVVVLYTCSIALKQEAVVG